MVFHRRKPNLKPSEDLAIPVLQTCPHPKTPRPPGAPHGGFGATGAATWPKSPGRAAVETGRGVLGRPPGVGTQESMGNFRGNLPEHMATLGIGGDVYFSWCAFNQIIPTLDPGGGWDLYI